MTTDLKKILLGTPSVLAVEGSLSPYKVLRLLERGDSNQTIVHGMIAEVRKGRGLGKSRLGIEKGGFFNDNERREMIIAMALTIQEIYSDTLGQGGFIITNADWIPTVEGYEIVTSEDKRIVSATKELSQFIEQKGYRGMIFTAVDQVLTTPGEVRKHSAILNALERKYEKGLTIQLYTNDGDIGPIGAIPPTLTGKVLQGLLNYHETTPFQSVMRWIRSKSNLKNIPLVVLQGSPMDVDTPGDLAYALIHMEITGNIDNPFYRTATSLLQRKGLVIRRDPITHKPILTYGE